MHWRGSTPSDPLGVLGGVALTLPPRAQQSVLASPSGAEAKPISDC